MTHQLLKLKHSILLVMYSAYNAFAAKLMAITALHSLLWLQLGMHFVILTTPILLCRQQGPCSACLAMYST